MPDITAMVLPGNTLSASQIDLQGLFKPANPPDSLEILNGGLDISNYGSATGTLPAWACQQRSFLLFANLPFDDWYYVYAKQLSSADGGDSVSSRAVMGVWACSFFLPWTASLVRFSFQGLARQDATVWDTGGSPDYEYWDARVRYDDDVIQGLYTRFPFTRTTVDPPSTGDPGQSSANRWRWVNKPFMYRSGSPVAAGFHTIIISIWGTVQDPDTQTAKVLFPTGNLNVMAWR